MTKCKKIRNYLAGAIAVAIVAIIIVSQPTLLIVEEKQLPIFLSGALAIVFLLNPLKKLESLNKVLSLIVDSVFVLLSASIGGYILFVFDRIIVNPLPNSLDKVFAVIAIILVLEAVRRSVNLAVVLLAIAFMLYGFYGNYLPSLVSCRGYNWDRMASTLYLTRQGLYGIPLKVMLNYIVLFVTFGTFLETTGGTEFFIDISRSIAGRFAGGPAKVSVLASALMGSISGSAVANVATTGVITIPTMKKSGYERDWAAAIEAVASTGGQVLPPIMGSVAFIMAEFLGIPYLEVVKVAFIPAILFYISTFLVAHFYAVKNGIKGEKKENLPNLMRTVKEKGMFLIPLIVLVIVLLKGYSPMTAALYGLIAGVVVTCFKKETRLSPGKIVEVLRKTGFTVASLSCTGAAAGIVIGVVSLSGLGAKLSSILVTLAGGNLFVLLILTAIVSIIIGMGVTSAVAYILLATLVGSAIVQLGVSPIMAHMFILYFGILSMITPPVALASYAGAAIAESDFIKTGWTAFKIAIPAFLIPFFIIYNPALVLQADTLTIIWTVIISIVGVVFFASSIVGFFQYNLNVLERLVLMVGSCLLILPGFYTTAAGILIILAVLFTSYSRNKKKTVLNVTKTA
ncbi:MAG: TRAP transporter permease [Firmicutes bacterium]|nr:TRAP transporter permease [Bacillota bacterium]